MSYNVKEFDEKVVELLNNGGVGFLPTDTIYGLSEQLDDLGIKTHEPKKVNKYWPGTLSVIFESSQIPEWLQRGTNSLAVRLPDLKELRDLIAKTGPLVSTSANLQGQKPANNVKEAKRYFGNKLDFYVNAGELEGQSSTLVKIEKGMLKVLRQGAYELKP
jgi:tRNA threonylcarbamoyl adenosine modification protein (Sua5/YciO/YrdC/YwlC family)